MSTDSEHRQPSFRFRDKLSRLKDRVKDKVKDKAIKHNVTLFVHHNLTSNDTHDQSSRHGFRQHMHHYKDVLKNKTHYNEIKDKVKDKIDDRFDLHHNKTYPKGFYDSLFSPETENDVYLQTALICLIVIAILCIIPTIVIVCLPSNKKKAEQKDKKKSKNSGSSTNMIFFHIFLCELCYLSYILLAMINVWKDFRLGETLCDVANYGMYVTIPIMQLALLFLSIERLSKHFNLPMTCMKIFTKSYLIQVILCTVWILLLAILLTVMFIKKQFHFSLVTDTVRGLGPPIVGDIVDKFVSPPYHCSVDGRLSSIFKTLIIILFIVVVVKPIVFSIGFNLCSPFCCRNNRKHKESYDDRRTTRLVTIFLLLNFFFSFPFYLTSMFKSIFANIDSTKDTFSIVLKICFILRITNIIFECLAFYIFERNSWNLLRTVFYYCTCKKCPVFKKTSDEKKYYTKNPKVNAAIKETRKPSKDDHEDARKKPERPVSDTDEEDDDGSLKKRPKKSPKAKKDVTPADTDDDKPLVKPPKRERVNSDKEKTKKTKKKTPKPTPKKIESEESEESADTEEKSAESEEEIEEEEEEEVQEVEEVQPKSKPRRTGSESRIPNGASATTSTTPKHSEKPIRRRTPSPHESDVDARQTPSPVPKHPAKHRPSSSERSQHRHKSSSSSQPRTKSGKKSRDGRKKKPRKDHQTRILEMSDEV